MEVKQEIKEYLVDYECPECKNGYLRSTGEVLTSMPPQMPHKCNNSECDYIETFTGKSYPHKTHEKI